MTISRRKFIQGAAGAGALAATTHAPWVRAQAAGPIRVGLLTVKTGPLASGRHRHGARARDVPARSATTRSPAARSS